MKNRRICWHVLWAFGLAGLTPLFAARFPSSWQFGNSLYCAEFELVTPPSQPEAGYAVNVPICGLGLADGSDLVAMDEKGTVLPMLSLGESVQNTAIALVNPVKPTGRIYLFLGSKTKSAQNRMQFLPGLTLDVRTFTGGTFDNWKNVEKIVQKSERIGRIFVDQINQGYNPVDARDNIVMIFEGYLKVPQAGKQTLMMVTHDAGYLFVDGKLLLSRDGPHRAEDAARGECRAAVELQAGPRPIRLVMVQGGGVPMVVLARWQSAQNKAALAPSDYLQPGKTKLIAVSARSDDRLCPAFRYSAVSYIGYQGIQFTEIECATLNEAPADWQFSDGARFHGAKLRKLFVGLSAVDVKVRQDRAEASGAILFPGIPPAPASINNPGDFKHYSELILQDNPERISLTTLKGYRTFLAWRDYNPDSIAICQAILKKDGLEKSMRREVLLDLARAAGGPKPEQAGAAYQQLWRSRADEAMPANLGREYAEFALFRIGNLELAAQIINDLAVKATSQTGKAEVLSLQVDLALRRGETAEAHKILQQRLGSRGGQGENARLASVKINALRQRNKDLLALGLLVEARQKLEEWERMAPEERLNGDWSIARSRFWRALGWGEGALAELDNAILLNPLLPNLPEVEFERGLLLRDLGEADKATAVFKRMVQQYPNHPLAAEAGKLAP